MAIIKQLECDYLIVGAGSSPLAFLDTLLTELPDKKVIIIDKKSAPGGHWVDSYGFVHLHQPSLVYGIASKQLEGNWLKLMLWNGMLPWKHRASKEEILNYYRSFVEEKVASKQLQFFPNTIYDFEKGENSVEDGIHYFSSVDGSATYKVKVNEKLVDGTKGECIIPHENPLPFPVDEGIHVMTPNQIYDAYQQKGETRKAMLKNKYVVLGAGKTGADAIVYLQREMKIDPANIAWVIANDVWMLNAAVSGNPFDWPKYMARYDNDMNKAAFAMEEKGLLVRMDKTITPTRFRFPVIQPDEFELLKKVKTTIRRGRATAIRRKYSSGVTVEFGNDNSPWDAFAPIDDCVFVHAASPGPFNGYDSKNGIFESPKKMTLDLLFAPPVTQSMSCLAKVEAGRVKGTLNTDAMKRLAQGYGEKLEENVTDEDLLKIIVRPVFLENIHQATITQAVLLAILDKDPVVPLNWLKGNRLSMLSIPGMKCKSFEMVQELRSKGTKLGLTESEVQVLKVLSTEMEPLKGM